MTKKNKVEIQKRGLFECRSCGMKRATVKGFDNTDSFNGCSHHHVFRGPKQKN